MKKEIKITDRLIRGYIEYLQENEKSKSTIAAYQRELFSLQMFSDDTALTKERLLGQHRTKSTN